MSHRPRKRLGQNFLRDQSAIARILDCVDPKPGEHLAEPLLQRCASLGTPNVHNADALRFDFHTLIRDGQRLRLVGNLPYNISTPVLFHLIDQADAVYDMHFMLQNEVVDRTPATVAGHLVSGTGAPRNRAPPVR